MNKLCRFVLIAILSSIALCRAALAADQVELAVDDVRLSKLEEMTGERPADIVLELALAYDERGQFDKAMACYGEAAAQGVGVAELRLGWLLESGTGGAQSYDLARIHYERAVAAGVAEANMRLGLLYLDGWGVTRDVQMAVTYLQAAANAGYQPAQKILSEMYFSGTGVASDLKQALVWAEKAAAKKDPAAQTLAGAIRQKAARLSQDVMAAREWYQLSSEQEYAAGMREMASTFLKPDSNPEEVNLGIHWLKLASDNGDSIAAFYLAGIYLWHPQCRDVPGNLEKARHLLRVSSLGGETAATEVLGLESETYSLADGFQYVMTAPIEDRYVQRQAARPLTEIEKTSHSASPRVIKMMRPIYPPAMKVTKTDGTVTVEFIVDTTGRVRKAWAVNSTHQAFVDPALASVAAWRFLPGLKAGRPVDVRVQISVQFSMARVGGLHSGKVDPETGKSL